MAQLPKVEKHGVFGVTAQFVIEVQPLFIGNSFQQFFSCVPSYQRPLLVYPCQRTSADRPGMSERCQLVGSLAGRPVRGRPS
jgi:hypothetical protein